MANDYTFHQAATILNAIVQQAQGRAHALARATGKVAGGPVEVAIQVGMGVSGRGHGLGQARVKCFHAHFSRIAYTAKGEKCHMTFADTDYGPEFSHLAPVLIKYGLEPTIICESRGTQADDSLIMKRIFCEAGGAVAAR